MAISTLAGENGVINRAINAKQITEVAGIEEELQTAIEALKIDWHQSGAYGTVGEYLTTNISDLKTAVGDSTLIIDGNKITYKGIEFTIDAQTGKIIGRGTVQGSSPTDNPPTDPPSEPNNTPPDNSGSYALGFVDDLGTRATIYLYGNSEKQVNTPITTALTESPTGSTVVNYKSQPIIVTPGYETNLTEEANFVAYTVDRNGTYKFSATVEGQESTETTIVVSNIETFTAIDAEALSSKTDAVTRNNTTIAYKYKETNEKFAYVPAGYYVDTNSRIDTGLVITDGVDSNGYSIGNEWVWVPVNSTVENDAFYEADATGNGTMAGIDDDTKALKYGKYSLLYDFTTNVDTKVTTRTALSATKKKPSDRSGYREIAILTNALIGEKANLSSIYSRATAKNASPTALTSEKAVAEQYIEDYNSMVTSVVTYGGFYIGRYEITANGEKPGTSLTNSTWYALYNKCMTLNKENTETSMMYGSLWDATMQWLSSNYNVGYTGSTSSGYGNYKTEAVTVSNSDNSTTIVVKKSSLSQKLGTGQTSYTKSNNIYDLSGNCYEWTQEAYGTDYRLIRGGYYDSTGSGYNYSAGRRLYYDPTSSYDYNSSRPQLYIK